LLSHAVGMMGCMLRHDAAIARPAAPFGLATRGELRARGLSDEAIDVRLEAGILTARHRGVLQHAAVPYTERTRLLSAVKACGPTAVASHRSAATLHGLEGIRRFRPEITVCDTTKPKAREITVHRTNVLDAVDRTLVGGIPVTAMPRTLLDLASVTPFDVFVNAAEVSVINQQVGVVDLVAVLDRLGKPGRRGTAPMRRFLREAIPDERLASVLERDLLRLITAAGLPEPMLQAPVAYPDGTAVTLDFAWPELGLAVEADGHRWHATRAQLERDLARRRRIRAAGWEHYAYGWGDVHDRPDAVIAELTSLFVALSVSHTAKATKSVNRG
jgi:hypothetical protein